MAQDRRLELTECGRRLQALFFHERAAVQAVGLQGLGLPSAAVEGKHELASKAFPERMVGYQPAQFGG